MPDTTRSDRRYTAEHQWIEPPDDAGLCRVGITDFAQEQLGDVAYVDLPAAGERLVAGESYGVVESMKTASELYAPVSGQVVAANSGLEQDPSPVNADPYGAGWLLRLRPDDAAAVDALLTAEAYRARVA